MGQSDPLLNPQFRRLWRAPESPPDDARERRPEVKEGAAPIANSIPRDALNIALRHGSRTVNEFVDTKKHAALDRLKTATRQKRNTRPSRGWYALTQAASSAEDTAMSAELYRFPLERMTHRVIIATLRPYIEQSIAAHPGTTPAVIADAALALIDPDATGPSLVREFCRMALEQIACDTLAKGRTP